MIYNESQKGDVTGQLSLFWEKVLQMSYTFEQRPTAFHAGNRFKKLWVVPHLHTHIELICLLEGEGTVTVDRQTQPIKPGDVFLSFPNQIHNFHVDPAKGFIFIVTPDLFPDLNDVFMSRVPVRPVIEKERLPDGVAERVEEIFRCATAEDRLQNIAANGLLQALLAQLLGIMELTDVTSSYDSVRKVLEFCSEHYREPLTLEVLAQQLHLSGDYISHMFSERLGIHFPDFINRLRVEQACRLLSGGCGMTEAAFNAGFGSIRSFNRNFKQVMGVSPTEYARN